MIDKKSLLDLFAINDQEQFRREHSHWVELELQADTQKRKELWSESIAVGSKDFVGRIQQQLRSRAASRSIISEAEGTALRESEAPYSTLFEVKKDTLRLKNGYLWETNLDYSMC